MNPSKSPLTDGQHQNFQNLELCQGIPQKLAIIHSRCPEIKEIKTNYYT
jgi:hypothetical protein